MSTGRSIIWFVCSVCMTRFLVLSLPSFTVVCGVAVKCPSICVRAMVSLPTLEYLLVWTLEYLFRVT